MTADYTYFYKTRCHVRANAKFQTPSDLKTCIAPPEETQQRLFQNYILLTKETQQQWT
jgi:hypothetical protein